MKNCKEHLENNNKSEKNSAILDDMGDEMADKRDKILSDRKNNYI